MPAEDCITSREDLISLMYDFYDEITNAYDSTTTFSQTLMLPDIVKRIDEILSRIKSCCNDEIAEKFSTLILEFQEGVNSCIEDFSAEIIDICTTIDNLVYRDGYKCIDGVYKDELSFNISGHALDTCTTSRIWQGRAIFSNDEKDFEDEQEDDDESTSIKLIIAFPEEYVGKHVSIDEWLVIARNDIKRKSFTVYMSKGRGRYEYSNDIRLEVFYNNMSEQLRDLVMVDADYQKIYVEGTVRKYSDSDDVYIDASMITSYNQ